jgi:DNA polymerase elongation subunit (family B)
VDEKVPVEKLIISKSLRSFYKNPKQIAHNVLAERIGVREPGNKPAPGDRIPYIYIETTGKKLQGDKIETPQFIKDHKLKIDYGYEPKINIQQGIKEFVKWVKDYPELI